MANNNFYKIVKGDTLSLIANDNGTTVGELVSINGIKNPNKIIAGDTIKLPSSSSGTENATSTTNTAPTQPTQPAQPTFDNTAWADTDDGKTASQKREEADAAVNNYGDFAYSNDAAFKDVVDKILNREQFSYDLNGDALYQQYKDKYIQQGKMAMQDTMGQAAAMTGGYGNSYAASVGNQAYQASLENLNDIVPELYQMAYDKYNQEGQDLYNQYSMLSNDKNMEYGMWGDELNRLMAEREYADSNFYNGANLHYTEQDSKNSASQQAFQNAYNMWSTNNSNARQDAYAMLQVGVMPSHDVLQAAGISVGDAQKIIDAYKSGNVSGSSGSSSSGGSGSGSGSSGGSGGNGGTGSGGTTTSTTSGVRSDITAKLKGLKTNEAKRNYINGLVADGTITEDQAVELYGSYLNSEADLKDRTWTKTGKDTFNWLWGVDNDDQVIDQYGNVYRLDDLVDALVEEGMSRKEAKEFVKKYN